MNGQSALRHRSARLPPWAILCGLLMLTVEVEAQAAPPAEEELVARYSDLPQPQNSAPRSSGAERHAQPASVRRPTRAPATRRPPRRADGSPAWPDDGGRSATRDLILQRRADEQNAGGVYEPVRVRVSKPKPQARAQAGFRGKHNDKGKKNADASRRWIRHKVIGGERLDEIADRYGVRKASIIKWNKLDPAKPWIRAGQNLRVYAALFPPPREQVVYEVKRGDTWAKIAAAHQVDADHLRKRWNPKVPRRFKAGQEIVIWLEPKPAVAAQPRGDAQATQVGDDELGSLGVDGKGHAASAAQGGNGTPLPLKPIKAGVVAVGKPNRGKISGVATLPENDALYTLMRPEHAFGTTHALTYLQLAIAQWRRDSNYQGKLVIADISKRGGGKLNPHSSHRTGRDVDIRLPVKAGLGRSKAESASDIDWIAAWHLVKKLADTGQLEYIFLGTSRQKLLHRAAKKVGATNKELERIIQWPHPAKTNHGIVRHAKGHTSHIHVRFRCGPKARSCQSY